LIVEPAVAEVEGAARLGKWNLVVATFADDPNLIELLIVDNVVETAVLTDAGEFFESGFVVEGWLGGIWYTVTPA
jgi:hypothetical protein